MSQMHAPGQSQGTSQSTTGQSQGGTRIEQAAGPAQQGGSLQQGGSMQQGGQLQQGGQMKRSSGRQGSGAAESGRLFPTRSYLSAEARRASIGVLNQALADLTVMHAQLKSAHWNVKGTDFYQLHELFEELAETFVPFIDEVAERATALGGTARGTVRLAASESRLPELPPEVPDQWALLERVAESLATLDAELFRGMQQLDEDVDIDTVDLLNEVSREVSKSLWFVEAHLQGTDVGAGTAGGHASGAGGTASGAAGGPTSGSAGGTTGGTATQPGQSW